MNKPEPQPSRLSNRTRHASPGEVFRDLAVGEDPPARSSSATATVDAPPTDGTLTKVSTRLTTDQVAWVQTLIKEHRAKNPHAAMLRKEEVMRFALDYFREAKDVHALVGKYRK